MQAIPDLEAIPEGVNPRRFPGCGEIIIGEDIYVHIVGKNEDPFSTGWYLARVRGGGFYTKDSLVHVTWANQSLPLSGELDGRKLTWLFAPRLAPSKYPRDLSQLAYRFGSRSEREVAEGVVYDMARSLHQVDQVFDCRREKMRKVLMKSLWLQLSHMPKI